MGRPVPHTQVHQQLRRVLENVQDVLIILLMVLLLIITLQMLWRLAQMIFVDGHSLVELLSQVVFVLIVCELYRTLIFYLREHRVSVALMVEVTIVSLLRELILTSGYQLDLARAAGGSLLLLVLGVLLMLERRRSGRAGESSDASAH